VTYTYVAHTISCHTAPIRTIRSRHYRNRAGPTLKRLIRKLQFDQQRMVEGLILLRLAEVGLQIGWTCGHAHAAELVSALARNRGGWRAWNACSNAKASLISVDSWWAPPKNEMPTGSPNTYPAGTVMLG
jgi:hypothetical protein